MSRNATIKDNLNSNNNTINSGHSPATSEIDLNGNNFIAASPATSAHNNNNNNPVEDSSNSFTLNSMLPGSTTDL